VRADPPQLVLLVGAGPEVALGVEAQAVRPAAGLQEGGQLAVGAPLEDAVVGLVGEEDVALGVGGRPLREREAVRQLLQPCAGRDEILVRPVGRRAAGGGDEGDPPSHRSGHGRYSCRGRDGAPAFSPPLGLVSSVERDPRRARGSRSWPVASGPVPSLSARLIAAVSFSTFPWVSWQQDRDAVRGRPSPWQASRLGRAIWTAGAKRGCRRTHPSIREFGPGRTGAPYVTRRASEWPYASTSSWTVRRSSSGPPNVMPRARSFRVSIWCFGPRLSAAMSLGLPVRSFAIRATCSSATYKS